ncbi:Protein required for ethanol metabolism [Ceratobasidium sp. 370]|nr:Protein required for ethanol metabolism [Ceratobasidium sp. 370]
MQAYTRFLNRRPFLGPCITTAVLFAVGDVVAQQGVDRRGLANDWVRTARLGTYGGAVFAPIVIKWYKVALDQFAFAPFAIALFFGCTTLMEGKSIEDVRRKLNSSYKDTLVANWGLFIPFQTVNMGAS